MNMSMPIWAEDGCVAYQDNLASTGITAGDPSPLRPPTTNFVLPSSLTEHTLNDICGYITDVLWNQSNGRTVIKFLDSGSSPTSHQFSMFAQQASRRQKTHLASLLSDTSENHPIAGDFFLLTDAFINNRGGTQYINNSSASMFSTFHLTNNNTRVTSNTSHSVQQRANLLTAIECRNLAETKATGVSSARPPSTPTQPTSLVQQFRSSPACSTSLVSRFAQSPVPSSPATSQPAPAATIAPELPSSTAANASPKERKKKSNKIKTSKTKKKTKK